MRRVSFLAQSIAIAFSIAPSFLSAQVSTCDPVYTQSNGCYDCGMEQAPAGCAGLLSQGLPQNTSTTCGGPGITPSEWGLLYAIRLRFSTAITLFENSQANTQQQLWLGAAAPGQQCVAGTTAAAYTGPSGPANGGFMDPSGNPYWSAPHLDWVTVEPSVNNPNSIRSFLEVNAPTGKLALKATLRYGTTSPPPPSPTPWSSKCDESKFPPATFNTMPNS